MTTIRVVLPPHVKMLADVHGEIEVDVPGKGPSINDVLDVLEDRYPPVRGTIRHHRRGERRPLMRFFACGEDLSYESLDTVLPNRVLEGSEALLIVGAIAGG